MIVREHYPSPNGKWCLHCGATRSDEKGFGIEATCVARQDGHDPNKLRPEPALRIAQADDFDTICKRIGELYQQRTEAMNHVDDEPKLLPEADIYGDCYG